jgi:cell wall-associated NlpC family hydrolase
MTTESGLAVKAAASAKAKAPRAPSLGRTPSAAGAGAKVEESPLLPTPQAPRLEVTEEQYNGSTSSVQTTGGGVPNDLLAYAKQFVGTPYVWGGNSPLGFDCSGFVQYVYRHFGRELPRISYQQAQGKRISLDQAKVGDLVAWDTSSRNNGADHIAIYAGNGMVIHAPKPGDRVKISKVWGNPWAVSMG